jgi:choline dehydrogenase-like flavoprotein
MQGEPDGGAAEQGSTTEREAIVIGSGFGGAVAACRLAQAGFRVLVLERGRRYEAKDFPALPVSSVLAPDMLRWSWAVDQGLYDVLDLEEILTVQAAGYGGGSLIYANVHLRPPDSAFDDRWPEEYRQPRDLDRYFDLAAYMLGAAPIETHPKLIDQIVKAKQLEGAAKALGRTGFFHPPLTISSTEGPNAHGVTQHPCTGCGGCITGCPEGAKNTLDKNYLAVAERNRAEVRTQCEVLDIEQLGERLWAVHCMDHLRAQKLCFVTQHLFLCAGSIHSTRLLARARLLPEAAAAGGASLAGIGYFPDGDALGVIYDTEHPQHPSVGPTITTSIVHWNDAASGSFFLVQDGGYAPEVARLVGTLRAPAWVGRNRATRSGRALVGASDPPTVQHPRELDRSQIIPSPIDALLDALKAGDLNKIPSGQLRDKIPAFLEELEQPLLLPAIVDRTVDGAVRGFTDRYLRWFSPDGCVPRAVRALVKWGVGRFFGTNAQLADRAFRAALTGADLDRAEIARRVLNYDAAGSENRVVLLGMGRDAASGLLHYDARRGRLIADLDLFHLAPGYARTEQLMGDIATALGGELRTSPAWAFLGKPITVHNLGGCPMSKDPAEGVTDPDGQVHGRPGLYVLDGSILCSPPGVNPSATITAIAERNIGRFLEKHSPRKPGGNGRAEDLASAAKWAAEQRSDPRWVPTPPPPTTPAVRFRTEILGLELDEIMEGHYSVSGADPRHRDAEYRLREAAGRPHQRLAIRLHDSVANLAAFFEDQTHRMEITGHMDLVLPDGRLQTHAITGSLELFVPRFKPYDVPKVSQARRSAQKRLARRPYTTRIGRPPQFAQRYMLYKLRTPGPEALVLEGYKRVRDDPGFDAWRDTSTLFFKLRREHPGGRPFLVGAGALHMSLENFFEGLLPSIRITGTEDAARITWATARFATFFFGTLQRVYSPGVGTAIEALFKIHPNNVRREP